jgi:hypothetical protein
MLGTSQRLLNRDHFATYFKDMPKAEVRPSSQLCPALSDPAELHSPLPAPARPSARPGCAGACTSGLAVP